jgi:2-aminoethylphosphonate-pyruvate transaminase
MKTSFRLFTPGPLNTSDAVRAAMNADLGARTSTATLLTQHLRHDLAEIAACDDAFSVIPLQGSGTFAVEAMLCSFLAENDHVLIAENGAYSQRMAEICRLHRLHHTVLEGNHALPVDLPAMERELVRLGDVTHIAVVHFETALGVLNDVQGLISLAARHGCRLLVDAVSTFGALPLDFTSGNLAAVAASANKCLHGVPGVAFVIAERSQLGRRTHPATLSLDLNAQHRAFEVDGQWRFTPPLQVLLALRQAIAEFREKGGVAARYGSYQALASRLIDGLACIGVVPLVPEAFRAPMITTFTLVSGARCDMENLHALLYEQGLVIYPSQYSPENAFRIGCIGELQPSDVDRLIAAMVDLIVLHSPCVGPMHVFD